MAEMPPPPLPTNILFQNRSANTIRREPFLQNEILLSSEEHILNLNMQNGKLFYIKKKISRREVEERKQQQPWDLSLERRKRGSVSITFNLA